MSDPKSPNPTEPSDSIEVEVDDESTNDPSHSVTYNISSYGADYTVDSLVSRMAKGTFFVPPFQRSFVWTQKQASRFIESLLLGLPVPSIFVAKEPDSAKHLIVDGQQRLKSLQFFFDGSFNERKFRLLDVNEQWNGKTIDELQPDDKQRLEDSVVHTIVFKQDAPESDDTSIYHVFERLNTGASKLTPQEIRTCVNYGAFTEFLSLMNEDANWRKIFGAKNKRMKDQELILRFLAFFDGFENYSSPMKDFLNLYMQKNRDVSPKDCEGLAGIFQETISIALSALGEKPFRPERNLNAAVFDSVMVGLARRLILRPIENLDSVKSAYFNLLNNEEFKGAYLKSTANEDSVATRFSKAIEYFEDVV